MDSFNPKGVPALYLGASLEAAILEAAQGFGHKFEPLTICMVDVDCADIVDLSNDAARADEGVAFDDMGGAWGLALAERKKPVSWTIAEALIARGAAGVLVPSFAHRAPAGLTNLVLWKWGADLPHKARVIDPNARLPRNQRSSATEE
ncbi:MAG TPA: RES domain-containing protein [Beijerinckiaceae bacterium]|nr:RES domain-containing protein [Beijerinckiaceae bacterium]